MLLPQPVYRSSKFVHFSCIAQLTIIPSRRCDLYSSAQGQLMDQTKLWGPHQGQGNLVLKSWPAQFWLLLQLLYVFLYPLVDLSKYWSIKLSCISCWPILRLRSMKKTSNSEPFLRAGTLPSTKSASTRPRSSEKRWIGWTMRCSSNWMTNQMPLTKGNLHSRTNWTGR